MLQCQKIPLTVTRGLALSVILEYKEANKRVYTDYTGWEFKSQFREGKDSASALLNTTIPVAVGLGQIQLDLTVPQTTTMVGQVAYYDVLAKAPGQDPEKIFEGTVPIVPITPTTVTVWVDPTTTTTVEPTTTTTVEPTTTTTTAGP
jgi:hypothetical protein